MTTPRPYNCASCGNRTSKKGSKLQRVNGLRRRICAACYRPVKP